MKNHSQLNTSLPELARILLQAQYHYFLIKCKNESVLLRAFRTQYRGLLASLADLQLTTMPKALNQVIIATMMTETPPSQFAAVVTKGWLSAANSGKNVYEIDSLRHVSSMICYDYFLMKNCIKKLCLLRHTCPCNKDHFATNCPKFILSEANGRSLTQNLNFNKLFYSVYL